MSERLRPALLINPNAWLNAQDPARRLLLRRLFEPLGETAETPSVEVLPALLRRWREQGVNLLVVSGGDGAFHQVVREVVRLWPRAELPRLLPLHGGTIGVIASAVGSLDPLATVGVLKLALARGAPMRTTKLATLSIGGRVAFNFGIGVFSFLTQEYAKKSWRGPWGVRRVAARMIGSALVNGTFSRLAMRAWRGEVVLDGAAVELGSLVGLYASGVDNLWAFKGFHRQPIPAGQFRTMRLNTTPRGFIKGLLPFTMGWGFGVAPVQIETALELFVRAEAPYTFLADGEFYLQDEPLWVRSGPLLEVLQP